MLVKMTIPDVIALKAQAASNGYGVALYCIRSTGVPDQHVYWVSVFPNTYSYPEAV